MVIARNSSTGQPSVPLAGEVGPLSVPWFFQTLRVQSKTGTAVFEYVQEKTAVSVTKKVYFKDGDILFAQSSLSEDRLSDRLFKTGKLTELQYNALSELLVKTGKKQGAIMTQLGFLTPDALIAEVKDQIKAIVLSLFAIRMGSYRFDEAPLPLDEIIPLRMSTGNITLESINSLDWQIIRKSLPPPDAVIRPAADPSCLFQDAQLSPDQQTIFGLLDGKRSVEEVCSLSGLGDFNALKAVYLLLALRMAEVGAIKNADAMEDARHAVREALRPKHAEPAVRETREELPATRESILQAHAALATQSPYQVLGLDRTASPQEIKRRYFRLAKAYHPDRHFDQTMADLKPTLQTLFMGIHGAYEILSDPAKRSEYDSRSGKQHAAPAAAPRDEFVEKRAEGYQENYAEKVARASEQFDAGMKDFKVGNYWGAEEKFAWACRMDPIKATYFFYHGLCLANIPRRKHDAEEQLQKAIELDATKTEYHIELSNLYLKSGMKSKALAVLNNALQHVSWTDKIEEALTAAGEGKLSAVLYGEGGAKEPSGTSRQSGQGISRDKAAQARDQFNRGIKEFKANNFGLAVDPLGSAVRLDPAKAEYHYYYGVSLSRIARRQEEAETPLKKALELDPAKPEHHLELGAYYLKNGQKAKALGVLNNALLRHPNSPKILEAIKSAGGSSR